MALQNRVAPDGGIFTDPARGLLMGNRGGVLHDDDKRLTARRWASKHWIACALTYKGRRETIMAPRHYTQLFFLDEATALAAGHRPCALCRRGDFLRFTQLWQRLHGMARPPKVAEVDAVLHAERVGDSRAKVKFAAKLADLPSGAMVEVGSDPTSLYKIGGNYCLYVDGLLLPWSPSGYGTPINADVNQIVRVLTPRSIVSLIAAGYAPMLHPSARVMSLAKST